MVRGVVLVVRGGLSVSLAYQQFRRAPDTMRNLVRREYCRVLLQAVCLFTIASELKLDDRVATSRWGTVTGRKEGVITAN